MSPIERAKKAAWEKAKEADNRRAFVIGWSGKADLDHLKIDVERFAKLLERD